MTGMWLALAGFFAVVAAPSSRALRVERLVGGGRLGHPSRRGTWRRGSPAVPAAAVASGPTTRIGRWWVVGSGLTGAAAVVAVFARAGPVLAAMVATAAAVAARLVWDVRIRRAAARGDAAALAAVRVLVGELRAGSAPADALGAAAQAAPLLAAPYGAAAELARRGEQPEAALTAGAHPGVRVVGAAWAVGAATGAPLAGVLARVATDLESAAAQRRATAVALAGPRSSATVLAGLPLLGVGLGTAMGARPLAFLVADPAGRLACCAGVLLDAGGVLWVRAILRRSEAAP